MVHLDGYTGFANIVDRVNKSTPVNRPTMDSMLIHCLKGLYAKWEPKTKMKKEKEDMFKMAILQVRF